VEFALVALLFLSIVFLSFNFFFWMFAKAALHNAVREGARYAITGQTTGPHQDESIRQVVRDNAFGLLKPADSITVAYFAADGSSTSSNAAGNVIVVSVPNYTPAKIASPLLSLFMSQLPSGMSVSAVDKVEPFSGAPPIR
jgi:Flp pilus assembly protein TadG